MNFWNGIGMWIALQTPDEHIPEPEGVVIVVDATGDRWTLTSDGWTRTGNFSVPWEDITVRGPVKIYRLEETK